MQLSTLFPYICSETSVTHLKAFFQTIISKIIQQQIFNFKGLSKYNLRITKNTSIGVDAVKDILASITEYRVERGWTEYRLAERSGLPQSTISSWYRKNMVQTIPSLEKICAAFGITLSHFFAEGDAPVSLTESQRKLLERWSKLSPDQQAVVFALIEKM